MSTPNGTTINATTTDGTAVDVTEAVQILYDLLVQSLDWGSGFLGVEEVVPIYRLAELCGFGESPREYLIEQRVEEKYGRWVSTLSREELLSHPVPDVMERRAQWRIEAEREVSSDG